jgi:putative heme-binding domain-containing protein
MFMRATHLSLLVFLLAMLSVSSSRSAPRERFAANVVAEGPKTPAEEKKLFNLPPGFEMQLVAAEPDIQKPLNIAFDDRGRLWVTDTIEYPHPAKGRKGRDTVKILEDFAPNGKARKITTFADGLNIPIGLMPLPGVQPVAALVHSIPSVWRLTDTKKTGKADKREVAYDRIGFADTHGMTSSFTWGFDGWIYACHGFANHSSVKGKDGHAVAMHSGNTYRMKPDGSRAEAFTRGQVNPFGLCVDPRGYFYTADCHSQPVYQLIRGGDYPSFAKPHSGLGFAPEMYTDYKGSTAVCGIAYYSADNFPAPYRGHLFVGDVMTNEIVLFKITWHGSTPKAKDSVFMSSDDRWFRPVDIKLGPDGALYVADFYNCIIGHYEVDLKHPRRDRQRGRIWRIVYTGKDGKGTPAPRLDYSTAKIDDLVKDLRHPNLTVRMQATNQLAVRGGKEGQKAVLAALDFTKNNEADIWQRTHGLWVLKRTGGLDEETLAKAMTDKADLVRGHACRIIGEQDSISDAGRDMLVAGIEDKNAHVQRAAAEALGRHPLAPVVRPLLELRHKVPAADTHLLHTVRIALRDHLKVDRILAKLQDERWAEQDARALADVALGVPSREASTFLLKHAQTLTCPLEEQVRIVHHVARYGDEKHMGALLTYAKGNGKDRARSVALLRALHGAVQEREAKLNDSVNKWAADLTEQLLTSKAANEIQWGIELTGLLRQEPQQKRVVELALSDKTPVAQRSAALHALAAIDAPRHAATLGKVLINAGSPLALRQQCGDLLARANQPATRDQLVAALATAPATLQRSIAAGLAGSREGSEKLLDAVKIGKASARLLQERAVTVRLEAHGLPKIKERLAKLTQGLPSADKKLQELLAGRQKAFLAAKVDKARGFKVFEKNCANCHQVAGKGAKIGPQLDGIGIRGLERLLEDTLDPNRNVDQAFRTTTLRLAKGGVVSGLLLREEGAVYVLADAQGKDVRVPKKNVEERELSPLSPMPANFAEQIKEADFYDMMAYLLSLKPGDRK